MLCLRMQEGFQKRGALYISVCRKAASGVGDCLKTQIMQKSPPTDGEEIGVNFQCKSHFMTKNSNKNGMGTHRPLVFGQSGGGSAWYK